MENEKLAEYKKNLEEKKRNKIILPLYDIYPKVNTVILNLIKERNILGLNTELPNIAITLNNKLVELNHVFKRAGISMFGFSILGDATIEDLINYQKQGIQKINDYNETMGRITNEKIKNMQENKKTNKFKRYFSKIKNDKIIYTKEEIEELNAYLEEYKKLENKLYNYDLKDHIVPSLVKELRNKMKNQENIPKLLENEVIPELNKLGLSYLVSELKEALGFKSSQDTGIPVEDKTQKSCNNTSEHNKKDSNDGR